MGNKIASELIAALRLSTAGTTLCSRSVTTTPEFVDISKFPGVAKAMVFFNGYDNVSIGNNCTILRSYNVSSVQYVGTGKYKIIFNETFKSFNLSTNYIVNGCVQTKSNILSSANMLYIVDNTTPSLMVTTSSFVVYTQNTSMSGVSAANAKGVYLTVF